MKKITLLTAAAAVALSLPALAGELGVNAGAGVDAKSTMGATSPMAPNTSANANANFGSVVSAMNRTEQSAVQIQSLSTVQGVTIVDVSTLAESQNSSALTNAKSRNQADIEQLHAAIENNHQVMAAIEAEDAQFDIAKVVAADVATDGNLVIYIQG